MPSISPRQPSPSRSRTTLDVLPPELLSIVIGHLGPPDKLNLKYTNTYLHSWIQVRCQIFKGRRRMLHINRFHRDMGSLPAAVICPHCKTVRLRSLEFRGPFGTRTWALKRLTWREQLHACCESRKPHNLPKWKKIACNNGERMERQSERIINSQQPGTALFLICLHCSNEVPLWEDDFAGGQHLCPRCLCQTCPTVFMPRKIALSPVEGEKCDAQARLGTRLLIG